MASGDFSRKRYNHCFPPCPHHQTGGQWEHLLQRRPSNRWFNHASQSPDEQAGESPDKLQTDAHMLHKMHTGELARSSSRQRRDYVTISTC